MSRNQMHSSQTSRCNPGHLGAVSDRRMHCLMDCHALPHGHKLMIFVRELDAAVSLEAWASKPWGEATMNMCMIMCVKRPELTH